jgi:hypothetical protein
MDVGARNGAKPANHVEDNGAVAIDDFRGDFHSSATKALIVRALGTDLQIHNFR